MTEKQNTNNADEFSLEAAMNRLTATARLHKHQPNPLGTSPPSGQVPDLSALLTGRPLTPTRDNPNPADTAATKLLMDFYHKADGWHCPKCTLVTTNPDEFVQHIADEFTNALAAWSTQVMQKQTPSPKPKTK